MNKLAFQKAIDELVCPRRYRFAGNARLIGEMLSVYAGIHLRPMFSSIRIQERNNLVMKSPGDIVRKEKGAVDALTSKRLGKCVCIDILLCHGTIILRNPD